MSRRFFTLDVFSDKALGGNPLAVVLDCDGLDDKRMQAIAAEFNLSETVFVFPPENEKNHASLRIFTPKNELPFAGHPTVGTAVLLGLQDGLETGQKLELALEEKVGTVACGISFDGNTVRGKFSLPKLPVLKSVEFDSVLLAKALGLKENQLGIDGHHSSICDAGVPFPVVPLVNLEAMAAIEVNEQALAECFSGLGFALELYVYCHQCSGTDSDYHVRMFAPAMGIAEDPATGSAAAAFAAQLMEYENPGEGTHTIVIEQGIEMGRPSRIELTMDVKNGQLVTASIGGAAVIVSEGRLFL
ncbi:MAG: PhzF family phenazine biosynthesis protein [Rhizobiaceae bacterium]|nr:PhzF family phenazine biosynthesis protein [Rhizobiaceae bacterium]